MVTVDIQPTIVVPEPDITINLNQTLVQYFSWLAQEMQDSGNPPQVVYIPEYSGSGIIFYFNGTAIVPLTTPSVTTSSATTKTGVEYDCDTVNGRDSIIVCKRNAGSRVRPPAMWILLGVSALMLG